MNEDKELTCCECTDGFVWTEGEQSFMQDLYDSGKIQEIIPPKRCIKCRQKRKASRRQTY